MIQAEPQSRRTFLKTTLLLSAGFTVFPKSGSAADKKRQIMTVTGMIDAVQMKTTLAHEQILVDFIGGEDSNPPRWDRDEVVTKVLPDPEEAKNSGCQTLVDCTPNYLGRDVVLLKQLSLRSGLFIVTNTGYYGGSDNKFLPAHAFTETPDQLARRWINEWQNGIDGTGI